jgi:hypothetical protein
VLLDRLWIQRNNGGLLLLVLAEAAVLRLLARISQPTDLVVTVANAIGDPVANYSHRRGWVFPPPWPGVNWVWMDPTK